MMTAAERARLVAGPCVWLFHLDGQDPRDCIAADVLPALRCHVCSRYADVHRALVEHEADLAQVHTKVLRTEIARLRRRRRIA